MNNLAVKHGFETYEEFKAFEESEEPQNRECSDASRFIDLATGYGVIWWQQWPTGNSTWSVLETIPNLRTRQQQHLQLAVRKNLRTWISALDLHSATTQMTGTQTWTNTPSDWIHEPTEPPLRIHLEPGKPDARNVQRQMESLFLHISDQTLKFLD